MSGITAPIPVALLLLTLLGGSVTPGEASTTTAIALRPDDVTTMTGDRGIVPDALHTDIAVSGFASPQDTLTWTVVSPREDDYAVSLIYSTPEPVTIEVRCDNAAITGATLEKTWPDRPFYWRQELPGTLHLQRGENRVVLRLPEAAPRTSPPREPKRRPNAKRPPPPGSQPADEFSLWSIELGTPLARQAQRERARALRGDVSWMVAGKYGLFVHWSPLAYALHGDRPRAEWHQQAVEQFDVNAFADAVAGTGAAWMNFTMTHGKFYWPGPSAALDRILPGRTTRRDLIGEIIAALDRRGIRTLFYLHNGASGNEDPEWARAVGARDRDTTRFGDNIEAILRESSLRYGRKLAGYGYIDCAFANDYPLDPPWERWARAIKAGNPDAIVGFSSQRGPTVSPFSEVSVTDGGTSLGRPNLALIGSGRQLGAVAPVWWCAMDGWINKSPMNGTIGPGPRHSADAYVDYFQQMSAAGIPVTINLIITADVVRDHPIFDPRCVAVMEKIRKAIREK